MSTSIINNVFDEFTIRSVIINDEPWFIAKDLADALGYSQTQALTKLIDPEDKTNKALQNGCNYTNQTLTNESGLYDAIFNSTLPTAKQFKKWVTSVVLPNLRKHGGYSVGQETLSPEMQEMINVQHKATALATSCMSGVVKSHSINKEDREKIFKVLMTVAHTCVTLDSLWSFERDAAGALARVGMGHHVKAIPLNMAKAQDDKWIHAKKRDIQVKRHKAEGNGWG